MSKIQTLGLAPRFYVQQLNLAADGLITDAEVYRETQQPVELQRKLQTIFRQTIMNTYNHQANTLENFAINVLLEGGPQSFAVREAAKAFTLLGIARIKAYNDLHTSGIATDLVRVVLYTSNVVKEQMRELRNVPEYAGFFNWFSQFTSLPHVNWAYNLINNIRAKTMGVNGGDGLIHDTTGNVVRQQVAPAVVTGNDWVSEYSQQVTQTVSAGGNQAQVDYGVLLGGPTAENYQFMLANRRLAAGQWPTDVIPSKEDAFTGVLNVTHGCLRTDKIKLNIDLDELARVGNTASYDTICDAVSNIEVAVDRPINDHLLDAPFANIRALEKYLAETRLDVSRASTGHLRLNLAAFKNAHDYVCDVTDKPWGEESLLEMMDAEWGSRTFQKLPDESLFMVRLGNRIYPCLRSTCHIAREWVERHIDYPGQVVIGNSDVMHYIIIPVIMGNTNQQKLMILNFFNGDEVMNPENYKVKQPVAEAVAPAVVKQKPGVLVSDRYLVGVDLHTAADMLYLAHPDNLDDTIVAIEADVTYIICHDTKDVAVLESMRTMLDDKTITNTGDMAEYLVKLLEEEKVTQTFINTISRHVGHTLMDYITNTLGIQVELEKHWIYEAKEVRNIVMEWGELTAQQRTKFAHTEANLLKRAFAVDDVTDKTKRLCNHAAAAGGFTAKFTHGKHRVVCGTRGAAIGTNVNPVCDENIIVILAMSDVDINPEHLGQLGAWVLGEDVMEAIKKVGEGIVTTGTVITNDGVEYNFDSAMESTDGLDTYILYRV